MRSEPHCYDFEAFEVFESPRCLECRTEQHWQDEEEAWRCPTCDWQEEEEEDEK